MSMLTMAYETLRDDAVSFCTMVALSVGLFGVVLVDETCTAIHRPFAFLCLCAMASFMIHHCHKSPILFGIVCLPLLLPVARASFVTVECLVLADFATFFLVLHGIDTFTSGSSRNAVFDEFRRFDGRGSV
jgi:hypothetical protein